MPSWWESLAICDGRIRVINGMRDVLAFHENTSFFVSTNTKKYKSSFSAFKRMRALALVLADSVYQIHETLSAPRKTKANLCDQLEHRPYSRTHITPVSSFYRSGRTLLQSWWVLHNFFCHFHFVCIPFIRCIDTIIIGWVICCV